jgi:HAD superfamily hydrolase (TIGR01549 family)
VTRPREPALELPRLVLFDMDDTVFDHSLTCRAAIGRLRREHPFLRRRSLTELWSDYLRLLNETHPRVALGRRSPDEARTERWQRIARSCGTTLSKGESVELSRQYRDRYRSLRRPIDGAPELLARLHRRARIGVVSNNELAEQEEKIRFLGIGACVDVLVVSAELGIAKPDPRIFRTALERAGVAAGDTAMIGDSWESDVLGARGAGIRPVWFNRFRLPRPDGSPVAELEALRPFREVETLLRHPERDRGRRPASGAARAL